MNERMNSTTVQRKKWTDGKDALFWEVLRLSASQLPRGIPTMANKLASLESYTILDVMRDEWHQMPKI